MKKVYIDSNGCAVLKHETERIARYFMLNGWTLERYPEVSDIVILTCCGVTHNEEDEAIDMLRKLESIRTRKEYLPRLYRQVVRVQHI